MTELNIGRTLETVVISIVANSDQSFGLDWIDAGSPANLTGITASIRLSSGEVWVATNTGSTTLWVLSAAQTALPWTEREGQLVVTQSGGDYVVALHAVVRVQR